MGRVFSFVDSFEIIERGSAVAVANGSTPAAPFFADHFPGSPLMPGVCSSSVPHKRRVLLWQHPAVPFLWLLAHFVFASPVLPGQTLDIEVTLEEGDGCLPPNSRPSCVLARRVVLKAH